MPRKGHDAKRDVLADPLYNNKVVTKLINNIMLDGKKGVAQKIVYGAFARVEEKAGKPALEVFEEAMNNIMPVLEVKARRIGGATYQQIRRGRLWLPGPACRGSDIHAYFSFKKDNNAFFRKQGNTWRNAWAGP